MLKGRRMRGGIIWTPKAEAWIKAKVGPLLYKAQMPDQAQVGITWLTNRCGWELATSERRESKADIVRQTRHCNSHK